MACDNDIDPADLAVVGWSEHEPRTQKGLLASEVPLRTDLRLRQPESLAARLALAPRAKSVLVLCLAVIANVLYACARALGTWVFYSRDRSFYAGLGHLWRYLPPDFTLRN